MKPRQTGPRRRFVRSVAPQAGPISSANPMISNISMRSGGGGQNLTTSIVQDLGIAIVTGRYSATNPFPVEGDLCVQYDASRSVVREAVKMLTAKGLLKARPRQGTWVQREEDWNLLDPDVLRWTLERKFSLRLLIEFTQVRLAVEPAAAALAAHKAGPAEREAISVAIGRMIAAERGQDDPLTSDIAFHSAILQASGNPFFAQLRELIGTALRFSIRRTNFYKGVRLASVEDHKTVSDAILAGDAPLAEASMRVLMQEALDLMKTAYADEQQTDANAIQGPIPTEGLL